ncbi:unnamed protein product [Fraxinus pennsylvanica]|uniref:Bidirectional sugar transporter SWEET n=1 Tax=Fraxinus pennsylvanica TaxID=56036 RepID=A0AAD2DVA1_9LAMI|nr:unnamed protein product [Fraxinus pennsylvanica]
MALFSMHNPLVFTFGILGNLVSFMVYLAPVPTFYRVYKKKSTEGFHSVPYVIALFSSMVWLFYAWDKADEFLLITINSVGCITEAIYVAIYIVYAHKKARILTLKLLLLLNVGGFGLIIILSHFLTNGSKRVQVLGWISVSVTTSVYIAPLSIMKQVIRTKSVEFMPISLSFFLILSAVMWFSYGLLLKDMYIAIPNILGLIFGVLQITLYMIYKRDAQDHKLPTHVNPNIIVSSDQIHPVSTLPLPIPQENKDENADDDKVEP